MMTLRPAPPDAGIVFGARIWRRPVDIRAHAENVGETTLGTTLVKGDVRVSHRRASALGCAGLGIDNLTVEVSAPEVADHGR